MNGSARVLMHRAHEPKRGHAMTTPKSTTRSNLKRCTKCGFTCDLAIASRFFSPRLGFSDGFQSNCKKCYAKYREEHRQQIRDYYHAHKDEHLEERKQYRLSHNTERVAYNRRYLLEHKEQRRAYRLNYYAKNPEGQRLRSLKYGQTLKGRLAAKKKNSAARSRRRNLPCDFSTQDWQSCFNYWHGCCVYCGKQAEGLWGTVHQEHFIPLNDLAHCPGTVRWNMLPSCAYCNRSKGDKEPRRWVINTFGKRKGTKILKRIDEYFESVKP